MNSETGEIMLFGVRVVVDSMRKSVSMNNLSQYELPPSHDASPAANLNDSLTDVAVGYASADDAVVHQSSVAGRERKRGVPWTEDEHKLFLLGLQTVGKGDWRGISRNFVKTRTPTQVASHAQKYFLRRSNLNRRRRRSSLFDITTDSVSPMPVVEEEPENKMTDQAAPATHSHPLESCNNAGGIAVVPAFAVPMGSLAVPLAIENPVAGNNNQSVQMVYPGNNQSVKMVYPTQVQSSGSSSGTGLNLDLNSTAQPSPVSLQLSLSSDQSQMSGHSSLQLMSFSHGDSMIRVA